MYFVCMFGFFHTSPIVIHVVACSNNSLPGTAFYIYTMVLSILFFELFSVTNKAGMKSLVHVLQCMYVLTFVEYMLCRVLVYAAKQFFRWVYQFTCQPLKYESTSSIRLPSVAMVNVILILAVLVSILWF